MTLKKFAKQYANGENTISLASFAVKYLEHKAGESLIHKIHRRLTCKHPYRHFIGAKHIYSDLWGYDHTNFEFRCTCCNKKKIIRTTNPDAIWNTLTKEGVIQ